MRYLWACQTFPSSTFSRYSFQWDSLVSSKTFANLAFAARYVSWIGRRRLCLFRYAFWASFFRSLYSPMSSWDHHHFVKGEILTSRIAFLVASWMAMLSRQSHSDASFLIWIGSVGSGCECNSSSRADLNFSQFAFLKFLLFGGLIVWGVRFSSMMIRKWSVLTGWAVSSVLHRMMASFMWAEQTQGLPDPCPGSNYAILSKSCPFRVAREAWSWKTHGTIVK